MTSFWQGDSRWGKEHIPGPTSGPTVAAAGCVLTTLTLLVNFFTKKGLTPLEVLNKLRQTSGALVDGKGAPGGSLMVWPVAAKIFGLTVGDNIAATADKSGAEHEYFGHVVDSNADLAGALASIMVDGCAAVRVDIDGDGAGDHTIACIGRSGDGFLCDDPALGKVITLDANLECADAKWGGSGYRVTAVRAVRMPT